MLLGDVVLPVDIPLQRREDALPPQQRIAAIDLQLEQRLIRLALCVGARYLSSLLPRTLNDGQSVLNGAFGRDGKVLELLAQYDDGLLEEQRVLHVGLGGRGRLGEVSSRAFGGAVKVVAS